MLGFTRSFLSAGASSLISSLWPVSDDATAVLMGTLYSELAKGRDIQRAMQAGCFCSATCSSPGWVMT